MGLFICSKRYLFSANTRFHWCLCQNEVSCQCLGQYRLPWTIHYTINYWIKKKCVQNSKIENVVNYVTILVVIIVKMIFLRSFFFYCLLVNYTFQTNPNTVTNLSKLSNYIAPASLFYTFLGTSYRFIISARNNFQTNNLTGAWSPLSQPSLRTTTLATYPTASLLAPTVSNIGSTTMTVAWHLAQDDGGNAVTHFIIWQRNKTCLIISAVEDCTENEWPSLSTYTNLPGPMVTNSDHSIVVVPWLSATMSLTYDYTHLAANVSYQYRISAVNSIGKLKIQNLRM